MNPETVNVAVVGASGAVGQEILKVLEQTAFPVGQLRLFGSERSAGRKVTFNNKEYEIELLGANPDAFSGIDYAFVSAGASTSRQFAPLITRHGAVMIDNSSAFRMDHDVPLVVPEVNGPDALNAPRGIIANPNCTTIQMVMSLKPINDLSEIVRVHVATYQAASGAGAMAMAELQEQHRALCAGQQPPVERFAHQLAYNVIPQIDVFDTDGYTREELKMFHETKKIMHAPGLDVSAMCVRVPVMRAHSEALWVETLTEIPLQAVRQAFEQMPGVRVVDNPANALYPMPLETQGTDPVFIGRLRRDLTNPRGITFWSVSDQIRKGAALNAVQIALWLMAHKR